VWGLFVLVPVEFVRALVYSILGDTFNSYESPMQAVRSFVLSLLILLVLGLILGVYVVGLRDLVAALSDPETLRIIAIPAAIIIADGVIALYFFRGNPRIQAVRIQAAAEDLADWLQLALFPTPFVLAFVYGMLQWLRSNGYITGAWLPDLDQQMLRSAGLLYAGYYFAGKALLLAHVHTRRFNGSGQRLLSAGWIQWLTTKPEDRSENARKEAAKQRQRWTVLQSERMAEPGPVGER
jgi:succinate dehydrogenase hydrophobic anchor subunit